MPLQIAVINRAVLAGEDAGPGPPGMVSAADYSEDDGPALPVTRTRSAPASVVARSQPAIMPYGPAGMLRGSWEDAAAGLAVKTATMLTGRGSGTLGLEQTTTGALPVVVEGQEHTLSCMHGMAEAHMHEGLARTVSLPQPDMQGCMQLGHMQMYDISNAGGLEHGMSYGGGLGRSMSLSASHADACASYSAHLSSSPRGSPNDRGSISSGGMKPRSVDGLSASLSGGGASTSSSGSSLNSGIVARSPSAMLMPIPEDGRVADVGGRSLSQSPGIFGSLGAFPPSFGAAASTAGANDFGPPRENAGRNSTRQSMSPFSSFTNASGGGGLNGAPWLQDGQASLGPVFCALEQQQ